MKTCSKCRVTKPLDEFHARGGGRSGRDTYCKPCRAVQVRAYAEANPDASRRRQRRWRARNPMRNWATTARQSARRSAQDRGLPFDLTQSFLLEAAPTACPILGERIEYGSHTRGPYSPSLDRLIPALGYIQTNVSVISDRANRLKSAKSLDRLAADGGHPHATAEAKALAVWALSNLSERTPT